MKSTRILIIVILLVLAVIAVTYMKPVISISNMKVESTSTATGIFFDIKNYSPRKICLIKAEIKELPNTRVMIHQTVEAGEGVYKMQMVEKLCIPPFGTVSLKHGPGGYHLMIDGTPNLVGKTLVLYFDDGSRIEERIS